MTRLFRLHTRLLIAAIAIAVTAALPQPAQAQATEPDSVTVSLVTYYPGSEIYELFGHTEVRVTDSNGLDAFFNYGVFDFNTPNFALRFASGETDYLCVAVPAYMECSRFTPGRKAVEQRLNLTQDEARQVRRKLLRNIMPDSATYRYKYVSDNCATRPRDIIEGALGSRLHWPADSAKATCREVMAHYNRNYPWEQMGIDIALGYGIDTVLTARQRMFVPVLLMQAAAGATIDRNGHREPLVAATTVLNAGSDEGIAMPPTPWYRTPMAVAVALLLIALGLSVHDIRRQQPSRWFDTALWSVATLAGMFVWFLIFISTHEATSPNVNGLWLHPFYAVPAVTVWLKRGKKPTRIAAIVMIAAIGVATACFATGLQQANAAFYPIMAALAMRLALYIKTPSHAATTATAKTNNKKH